VRIGDHQPEIDADEIIELCRKAKNAPKFASLFDDGDLTPYDGDDSDADAALLAILAFYTQDYSQLERLWGRSALGRREKVRSRADYRRRTIDFVLQRRSKSLTRGRS
jgi:primase-polymerase (primpol)-like protein